MQGFLDTVEARTEGADAILHTDRGFWQACTGDSTAFNGYPLWTADRDVARPTMYAAGASTPSGSPASAPCPA